MGDRDNCREVEGKREYLGGKRERRGEEGGKDGEAGVTGLHCSEMIKNQ